MSGDATGRNEMRAKMAATVAAGIEANHTVEWSPDDVAERAVAIVDSILERIENGAAQ